VERPCSNLVAVGQVLPSDGFVQFQGGFEIPWNRDTLEIKGFWRTAIGRSFVEDRFGRAWTPMVEIAGARPPDRGERTQWDVIPQRQVTLSRRQHIMVNAGGRIPLTERSERSTQTARRAAQGIGPPRSVPRLERVRSQKHESQHHPQQRRYEVARSDCIEQRDSKEQKEDRDVRRRFDHGNLLLATFR
jgi:hypothetical protein